MKNSYIALAVFSMAALLVSCETVNEPQNNLYIPSENEVVFTLAHNRIQTKVSDTDITSARVTTMDLGKHGDNNFFLEESIVNLDELYSGPETKGTPAYTENLGVLYKGKLGVYADGGNFVMPDFFLRKKLLKHRKLAAENLFRIVFNPSRLREYLSKFLLRDRTDPSVSVVYYAS